MGRSKVNLFKRKKKEAPQIISMEVPFTTLSRWYLYDIEPVDDINGLAEVIGLSPISEEGDEKERQESEARVEKIIPLMPFLDHMSDVSAVTMSAIHLHGLLDEDPDMSDEELEEKAEAVKDVYKAVALSTLMGTFSVALNIGIIHTDTVDSGVREGEDYL